MKKIFLAGVLFLVSFNLGSITIFAEESIADIMKNGDTSVEAQKQVDEIMEDIESEAIQIDEVTDPFNPNARMAQPTLVMALNAWRAGTAIVQRSGYPNTAMYMKHAELQNKGAKHTSNNNKWAKQVINGNALLGQDYAKFKSWIMGNSKTLTTKGSYAFKTGDEYYALHKVNYTYTYTRQANGGARWVGTVTDVYDFEWSKYNNIKASFANNYAVLATSVGAIKKFDIVITATSR